jgi:hypothetical protein
MRWMSEGTGGSHYGGRQDDVAMYAVGGCYLLHSVVRLQQGRLLFRVQSPDLKFLTGSCGELLVATPVVLTAAPWLSLHGRPQHGGAPLACLPAPPSPHPALPLPLLASGIGETRGGCLSVGDAVGYHCYLCQAVSLMTDGAVAAPDAVV